MTEILPIDRADPSVPDNPGRRPAYMIVLGSEIVWSNFAKQGRHYRAALDEAGLYSALDAYYFIEKRPALVLEGDFGPDRLAVIVRFPDRSSVMRFWTSESYQAIRPLRDGAGIFRIGVWEELPQKAIPYADGGAAMLVIAEALNWNRYQNYLDAIRTSGILRRFGATPLAAGAPRQTLEGTFSSDTNTVLIHFPSLQAITDFWKSDEYAPIRQLRDNAGRLTVAAWTLPPRIN